MAELEELKRQFEEMQRRFGEQSGMLEQARAEQREAFSLSKTVIEQQAAAQKHHLQCTSREIVSFQSLAVVVPSLVS